MGFNLIKGLQKKGLGSVMKGKAKKRDSEGANVRGTKVKTKREKAYQ